MKKALPIIAVLVFGVIVYLIVAKIKNLPPFQNEVPSTLKRLINADGKPTMTNGMYIRGYIDKKGHWIGGMLKDDTYNWKQSANGNACICINYPIINVHGVPIMCLRIKHTLISP